MQLSSQTEPTGIHNMSNSTAKALHAVGMCNETSSTQSPSSEFSLGVLVLLACLMVLLAVVTILGNVLVILAFILDGNLRHQSNYYFLNLAISDFAVGAFCMPLYIPYALTGTWHLEGGLCKIWLVRDYLLCAASVFNIALISYDRFLSVTRAIPEYWLSLLPGVPFIIRINRMVSLWLLSIGAFCMPLYIPYSLMGKWHLGRGVCKLWLVMDYLLCTASVFNIVLISYDRFLSITKAISYRAQQGITSNSVVNMVAIWLFAFLLYCPAILFWERVAGHSVVAVDQFFDNWYFLLSTLEFFVPLLLVTYFNVRIFHNIHRRQQHGRTQDCEPPRSSSLSWRYCLSLRQGVLSPPLEAEDSVSSSTRPKKERFINESSSPSRGSSCPSRGNSVTPERDFSLSSCARSRSKLQQDKKTTKSLAITVCVFAVCWAPYTLLMIIRRACKGSCVHNSLYEITFWLLWLNSSQNPFLYPLCHIKFQTAFMKILCPRKFATLRLGSF